MKFQNASTSSSKSNLLGKSEYISLFNKGDIENANWKSQSQVLPYT